METKINIAAILKDKPQGTKLYSSACGKCELKEADDKSFKVSFYSSKFGFMNGGEGTFDKNGNLYDDGECIIFPSKEMRNWYKFDWKKGDVLVGVGQRVIFEKFIDENYTKFQGKYSLSTYEDRTLVIDRSYYTSDFSKINASGNVENYFEDLEEKLGGKLNRQTLEVEKALPEFKDGDIVFAESHMLGINTSSMIAIFRKEKEIDKYKFSPALCESNEHDTYLREGPVVLSPSDIKIFRHATDSEKQQLFDALAKENKDWDSEHKMIVDLKPKVELKPFDKVLVRDNKDQKWKASFFGYKDENHFMCENGCAWFHCIPYEGNEHLLGTTKDVEG